MFDCSDLPDYISFEDFKEKGYFVVPQVEDYKPTPALRWFYEGRPCDTPDDRNPKKGTDRGRRAGDATAGRSSSSPRACSRTLPDDDERPPLPHYIPSWEGHTSELAEKYPLQLISPHPRFSFHTQHDKHVPWLSEIPGHRVIKDGYDYQVVRVHPADAAGTGHQARRHRQAVQRPGLGPLASPRSPSGCSPGVVHSYEGSSKYDPLEPGKAGSTDRGGCVNLLTPSRMMSKNVPGMAPNSCLVEMERWEA